LIEAATLILSFILGEAILYLQVIKRVSADMHYGLNAFGYV